MSRARAPKVGMSESNQVLFEEATSVVKKGANMGLGLVEFGGKKVFGSVMAVGSVVGSTVEKSGSVIVNPLASGLKKGVKKALFLGDDIEEEKEEGEEELASIAPQAISEEPEYDSEKEEEESSSEAGFEEKQVMNDYMIKMKEQFKRDHLLKHIKQNSEAKSTPRKKKEEQQPAGLSEEMKTKLKGMVEKQASLEKARRGTVVMNTQSLRFTTKQSSKNPLASGTPRWDEIQFTSGLNIVEEEEPDDFLFPKKKPAKKKEVGPVIDMDQDSSGGLFHGLKKQEKKARKGSSSSECDQSHDEMSNYLQERVGLVNNTADNQFKRVRILDKIKLQRKAEKQYYKVLNKQKMGQPLSLEEADQIEHLEKDLLNSEEKKRVERLAVLSMDPRLRQSRAKQNKFRPHFQDIVGLSSKRNFFEGIPTEEQRDLGIVAPENEGSALNSSSTSKQSLLGDSSILLSRKGRLTKNQKRIQEKYTHSEADWTDDGDDLEVSTGSRPIIQSEGPPRALPMKVTSSKKPKRGGELKSTATKEFRRRKQNPKDDEPGLTPFAAEEPADDRPIVYRTNQWLLD